MFTLSDVIDIAIQLEQNGANACKKLIEQSDFPEMIHLLEWIANEEQKHIQWFSQLKDDITTKESNHLQADVNEILLQNIVGKQTFSLTDIDISHIKNKQDLIGILIEFENDTILFYELLTSFVADTETKEHISQIVAEEIRHIEKLKALI